MKLNIFNAIFATIILGFIAYSCTEEVSVDTDSMDPKVVIYGVITTDTMVHQIKINYTADYFSNKPTPAISGAKVMISDSEGDTLILAENIEYPGIYETPTDFHGKVGRTYYLDVDIDGKKYNASSRLLYVPNVDSIRIKYEDLPDYWGIKAWVQEPEETRDFYMFKAGINGVIVSDTIHEWWVTEDEFYNGRNTNGIECQILQDEYPDENIFTGDTVSLEMSAINEDFYNFVSDVHAEVGGNDPMFSGPPANIRTNISGGAIGFFSAYSIQRSYYVVKEGDKDWDGKFD